MASLADAVLKGGVGAVGFLASAYTLTKFIVSTPVRIAPRLEGEHDLDVVLCFDTKKFPQAAVAFFVQMVRGQSHLVLVPKKKSILEQHEEEKERAEGESPAETHFLLGASHSTLVTIKRKKERAFHGEVSDEAVPERFGSGERIDLVMFELGRLKVQPSLYRPEAEAAGDKDTEGGVSMPEPFQEEEHGLLVPQAMHAQFLTEHFPLHDDKERSSLVDSWVKQWKSPQPMQAVRAYFGDEIGFYFAFLGMYTQWLIPLAALGSLTFLTDLFPQWGAYGRGLYSLLVTSWATAFLKFWKRQESMLRNEWGVSPADSLALEPARPDFWGEKRFDPVEGTYYTYFSSRARAKRVGVTIAATLVVLAGVTLIMLVYFWVEEWFAATFTAEKGWEGYYEYVSLIPSIVYSVVVLVLDEKYAQLSSYLSQYENHRTDSDFANAQVLKLASFYFVNNFGSLFYLAFKSRDMELLEQTLSSLLITRQLIGNLKEQLVPYLSATSSLKTEAGKLAKESHSKDTVVSKVDAELLFPTYDGTFEDYLELFVQFGQVTLFASAYPLASVWSLVNNVMEIRSDAFKLCMSFRRSRRASMHGIGTWLYAFSALGYLSVMTNCAIFGLHSGLLNKLFPKMSFAGTLVAVAMMEHVMVAVKVCIEMFVPDTPSAVVEAQRMERARLRKKAALQVELSSRQLLQGQASEGEVTTLPDEEALPAAVAAADVNEWLSREKERRVKLERELKSLNELYMGWIREEQSKRKKAEHKLATVEAWYTSASHVA